MADSVGGYDAEEFVENIHERFRCGICSEILKEPQLMTCCGVKFCSSCLTTWFSKPFSRQCPFCRSEKPNNTPWYVAEKGMKREIESFRVFCLKRENGCEWIGELRYLTDHTRSEKGCGYCEVHCPNKCESSHGVVTQVQRKDLRNHLEQDCQMRLVQCSYCDSTCVKKYFSQHTQVCLYHPVECPNGCEEKRLIRKDEDLHRAACPFEVVRCCYTDEGCEVKLKRQYMKSHEKDECQFRIVPCIYCKESIRYNGIQDHEEVCVRFPVQCPNGCNIKKIERRKVQNHRLICSMELLPCRLGCKEMIHRKNFDHHNTKMCQFRRIVCRYCKKDCLAKDLYDHNGVCNLFPISCPNHCGKKGIIRKLLNDHKKECHMEMIHCRYSSAGCNKTCKRYLMMDHEEDNQKIHLDLLSDAYAALFKKFESNRVELALKEDQLKKTTMELEQATTALEHTVLEASELRDELEEIQEYGL